MAKQNNLQLYRGQGVPPTNSMLEGEIAMDTDKKVLWINSGQAIKPVGIIEGGTTPSADYAGTLWIDNNASPTGIPTDFLVANNLTTQAPGAYVLDAYQGKILKDALDAQGAVISDQADEISGLSDQIDNLSTWNKKVISLTPSDTTTNWTATTVSEIINAKEVIIFLDNGLISHFYNNNVNQLKHDVKYFKLTSADNYTYVVESACNFIDGSVAIRQVQKGQYVDFFSIVEIWYK